MKTSTIQNEGLPSVIDTPYPFISIGDLLEVTRTLDPSIREAEVGPWEQQLQEIEQTFAPPGSTFYYIGATLLSERLEAMAEAETRRADAHVGVVHLDRYIGALSTNPDFHRLELSRGKDNSLMARVGITLSPAEQLTGLTQRLSENNYDEVVLVDDVLGHGDTVPSIVAALQ